MAARIESIATARPHGLLGKGALSLADEAAKRCLERAGRDASDVGLLINAGIYREKNLGEPALAAMIQEDIGANPGHPHGGTHGTFSFDVANGGGGVVTAVHLADGFLASGAIDLALVVASDSDPGSSEGFTFAPAGGALLLGRAPEPTLGFVDFQIDTYPQHADAFTSRVRWVEHEPGWVPHLHSGKNVLSVQEAPDFASAAVECAVTTVRTVLERAGLQAADIDLLVPSQHPRPFATSLGRALELPIDRLVLAPGDPAHTAGPLLNLEVARDTGRLDSAKHALVVTVGAGITVAVGLYRPG